MLVRELMTRRPALIAAEDSVAQAAEQMCLRAVGMLPVVDDYTNRRLVGVITDRDIVTRHVAKGHGPFALVRDYMTRDSLVTVRPDTPLLEVAQLMSSSKVRRLPVTTDDGVVVAVISREDLADVVTPQNPLLVERAVNHVAQADRASPS
jgi:CBS domain-containing protein